MHASSLSDADSQDDVATSLCCYARSFANVRVTQQQVMQLRRSLSERVNSDQLSTPVLLSVERMAKVRVCSKPLSAIQHSAGTVRGATSSQLFNNSGGNLVPMVCWFRTTRSRCWPLAQGIQARSNL
jgi:hypothetical protein